MKVAFIGLGEMGMPMAANLSRNGHQVVPWNRSRKALQGFGDRPPALASSIEGAVSGADAAITMLADDGAVESVIHAGLLDALRQDAPHVSMSTLSIDAARHFTTLHAERGRTYVAAPVFGRPDMAAARKLWIAVAGPAAARQRIRPLLDAMGRGVTEFGDEPWHANLVKLGNNFLLAAMLEAFGEAIALMRKGGIEPQRFMEAVNALFQSPVYANYGGHVADDQHMPALFKLPLGLKDVRLALAAADELAVPMPIAGLARDNLLSAIAHGWQDQDWSVLARAAQRRAGLD
jgi:3-hydroxyisobutyrate dehydrogenase-like beta-hydroxyacid dehydrogenase